MDADQGIGSDSGEFGSVSNCEENMRDNKEDGGSDGKSNSNKEGVVVVDEQNDASDIVFQMPTSDVVMPSASIVHENVGNYRQLFNGKCSYISVH